MSYIGGLYSGIEYIAGFVDNAEQVAKLDEVIGLMIDTNKQDSVVSIFMMPSYFYSTEATPKTTNITVERPTTLNGYKPRNNKLFTYPYCFLNVDCVNDCKSYRYEFSGQKDKITFALYCGVSPNVEIGCCPRNYNGSDTVADGIGVMNFTEELVMGGFPQCAFTIDAYRAWLAQKSTGDFLSLFAGGLITGTGIATGNMVQAGIGAVGAAQALNSMIIDATKGSTARGNQGGSALTSMRAKDFYIKFMCLSEDYARMIDDFFDRYGYTVDRVKIPNISSRPYWNYVKTKECTITGSIPSDDLRKICEIFDKGITFWKDGANVGDYSLDNAPA